MTTDDLEKAKLVNGEQRVGYLALYVCPLCGYVDHDFQDGNGHWEHGTSQTHDGVKGWSDWTLRCNGCGEVTDMPLATFEDVKHAIFKNQK